ncbi:cytochrome b [Vibrio hippocampi]|uniref:Cytochrome b561 n=1 Tax=Vibrio hippocampi TaxID=654686 RepID=A0ABM8ZGS4_9VIBR|nr:cytochrome b [Vibrio hippocampi]CAH0525835.1 Cytochrome b561 [Vibrio hippocampi]
MHTASLSKRTIMLHWATGILFLVTFAIGWYLGDMERGPDKNQLRDLHKSLGVLVMIVASLRLAWRIKEGAVPAIPGMAEWQRKSATAVHHLLLLATIAMPLSGVLMSIGGGRSIKLFGFVLYDGGEKVQWLQDITAPIHHATVNVLLMIIALHIIAALKHQFVDKDGTLSRMLGK